MFRMVPPVLSGSFTASEENSKLSECRTKLLNLDEVANCTKKRKSVKKQKPSNILSNSFKLEISTVQKIDQRFQLNMHYIIHIG